MEQAPEKMSDDVLLDQINCFDPYDVEFAKRYRAQAARIAHLEAQVAAADALADWVEGIIEDGCPLCGGDCSSSNPPPTYCPQKDAMRDLAAYNEAKKGPTE